MNGQPAFVDIEGPKDLDKDGDPEFVVNADLPGTLADIKDKTIELPIGPVLSTAKGLVALVASRLGIAGKLLQSLL